MVNKIVDYGPLSYPIVEVKGRTWSAASQTIRRIRAGETMPKNERRLTPKRQQFCDEHAERLDATKAAIKALVRTRITEKG